MNKNLLVIAVSIWMFTGCVSSKVERLHTTSTTLSTTFDKYEQTIDKALVFNRVTQEYNNRIILTSGLYPYQDDSTQPPEIWFSSSYSILNHNMLINEAISQQNKDLASYFKKLPLILEDKKADIAGLVKNIDVLNQVIEKNLEKGEELKEGLDKNQNDVITKSLSSAYSYYQYHIYKKNLDDSIPIILQALLYQKLILRENSLIASEGMNKKFVQSYNELKNNYVNQFQQIKSGKIKDREYSTDNIAKMNELMHRPYQMIKVKSMDQTLKKEPKIKSKAYMENCADNGTNNESFLAKNGKNIITFDKYFMGKKIGSTEVIFDIETLYKNSGDQMVCELINTLGLLQEHKFDQVELTTLEERVKSYEKIMDFVSKSYLAEIQGEKK